MSEKVKVVEIFGPRDAPDPLGGAWVIKGNVAVFRDRYGNARTMMNAQDYREGVAGTPQELRTHKSGAPVVSISIDEALEMYPDTRKP